MILNAIIGSKYSIFFSKIIVLILVYQRFFNLPQNGIPCGTHVPLLLQILRAGPKSSKPRSQEYRATVPGPTDCVLNSTVLWAGAPGNPQPTTDGSGKKEQKVFSYY